MADIRQKLHVDGDIAIAFATRAATTVDIEAEMSCRVVVGVALGHEAQPGCCLDVAFEDVLDWLLPLDSAS